ncbi:hypothetical protein Ahy_B09g095832 isoform B [Arachis hypogaea]|nr:hypothetical protein Ahy_B09g095832 isoform B [Arachis hypogaea]
MKTALGVMVSIIATITFQFALNPPGGVLQVGFDDKSKSNLFDCSIPNRTDQLCPGEAVLSLTKSDYYTFFLVCNTTCFIASLCVGLLLVSGLPLKNIFTMWMLLIGMWITLTTLLLTYFAGIVLITRDAIVDGRIVDNWFSYLLKALLLLFVVVGVFHVLHLVIWGVKKCIRLWNNRCYCVRT